MSDDAFQDEAAVDVDLDADDLVGDDDLVADDDLVVDDDLDVIDDDLDLDVEVVEVLDAPDLATIPADPAVVDPTAAKRDEDDDEVVDLDEELHPDDVEIPLDALLEEKTAAATMEDDEDELEEEEPESDERGEGPTRIVPRRPTEFHCSSCFLLLPRTQLADEERMLCRDCA